MNKYIFRLDDITPWMNWENLEKIEKIFDKFWIKPIIWVVPDNQDKKLDWYWKIDDFWWKIKSLEKKWWIISQHWYQHKYCTEDSWIIWLNKYSEFAWLPYEEQYKKIKKGKEILEENLEKEVKWWMAPAHSFDENTCKILKKLWFKYVTDWIALFPFEKCWLKWLPQQIWKPWNYPYWIPFGIWTICLHINTYDNKFFNNLERFLEKKHKQVISVNDIKKYWKYWILDWLFKIYFWWFTKSFKLLEIIKSKFKK